MTHRDTSPASIAALQRPYASGFAVSHDANKWNPSNIQLCSQQRRQAFRRLLRLAAQSRGENNSCHFFGMEKEMLTLTIYSHP